MHEVTSPRRLLARFSNKLPREADGIPKVRFVLAGAAILLLAAAAGIGTISMRRSQARLSECLSKTIAFAGNVDLARDAQVHFKRQVQEWKDVLLRGHKPADYAKYWSLFEREERETRSLLSELERRDPGETPAVDKLLTEHRAIGERYRAAIADMVADDPLSYRTVDARVRGMDRPLTDEMSAQVARLQGAMAELGARMSATHHAEIDRLRWAALTAALLGMLAMVMVLLLVRRSERERSEASAKAKSAFLATMSHEIRTPMNAVLGMAHLLEYTSLTAVQSDYLARLQAASKHLLSIIDDILDLSKIEASRLDLEHLVFSLDDVLDDVATLVGARAAEKGIELILSRQADVPVLLLGDPLRLGQIISNLASNAVKFTERGEVHVAVGVSGRTGDRVILQFDVIDTGIGLSQEEQGKLFRPFAQADGSTTRRFGGTGLGLAICARLVKLMGGSICVESQPGRGSRFFFTVALHARREDRRQQPGIPPGLHGHRVLIGEPNLTMCNALTEALAGAGLTVTSAPDGDLARAQLGSRRPSIDLALLNWRLCVPNVRELLVLARDCAAIAPERLLVMATQSDAEEAHATLRELGLGGLLIKPASPSALFDAVARAFGAEQRGRSRRATAGKASKPALAYQDLRGLRVLLVEDNVINQEVAAATLRLAGISVTVADNGQDAVAAARRAWDAGQPFHLVLMDRHMPGMDGLQTTRQIRLDPRCLHLPIIAMTADVVGAAHAECRAAGMNDFVSKPFAAETLFAVIRRWAIPDRRGPTLKDKMAPVESALPQALPGIDVREGLGYLGGNVPTYRKLMLRFRSEYADVNQRIARLLAEGAFTEAERAAHNVKSVAGQLGAHELQARAARLEEAIKAHDPDITLPLAAFAEALTIVLSGLHELAKVEPPPPEPAPTPVPVLASGLVKQVSQRVAAADPDARQDAERLRDVLAGEARADAEDVVRCLKNYDFDGAQDALQAVMAAMPAQGKAS